MRRIAGIQCIVSQVTVPEKASFRRRENGEWIMLKRIVSLVIMIPLGIVLIVLSVANREFVTLALNPFRPDDQFLSVSAPFFVFLFVALIIGLIVGAAATWLTQGKYRKRARNEAREAEKWHAEADRFKVRAEQIAGQQAQLPQS